MQAPNPEIESGSIFQSGDERLRSTLTLPRLKSWGSICILNSPEPCRHCVLRYDISDLIQDIHRLHRRTALSLAQAKVGRQCLSIRSLYETQRRPHTRLHIWPCLLNTARVELVRADAQAHVHRVYASAQIRFLFQLFMLTCPCCSHDRHGFAMGWHSCRTSEQKTRLEYQPQICGSSP